MCPLSAMQASLAGQRVSKFDDHLPLYRQHEIFARMGADIPESTLVGWCGRAMKTLSALIERIEADIMGKNDLAKAFRYGLSRQEAFSLFLTDGRVAIDNNPAERALRPIGIGRKNWLFAGADTGAETLARAMTVIETAKLNSLDPQAYLADVLDRIHDHKINRLDELLPWNWAPMVADHSAAA